MFNMQQEAPYDHVTHASM